MLQNHQQVPEHRAQETLAVTMNRAMLQMTALVITMIVLLASFYPQPLFLPAISSFLTLCAIGAAAVAALRLQKPGARYFTAWDVSAVLLFVALGAGMLTDPAAVEAYLHSVAGAETPAATGEVAGPPAPPAPVN